MALLLIIATVRSNHWSASVLSGENGTVDIAFEHSGPLSVQLHMSTRAGQALVMLTNQEAATIAVSVPATWERGEVRNASLQAVSVEPPMLGFVRWHLPGKSSVMFRVPHAPDKFLVHNPSDAPLKLTFIRVDLETEEVRQDVVLVKEDAVILE